MDDPRKALTWALEKYPESRIILPGEVR